MNRVLQPTILALVLFICFGVAGCKKKEEEPKIHRRGEFTLGDPNNPKPKALPWREHFQGKDKCETEFVVRFITDDLVSMLEYARTGKPPADPRGFTTLTRQDISLNGWPVYWVTTERDGDTYKATLDLRETSVWDADLYAKLIAEQIADAKLAKESAGSPPTNASPLLTELLEARLPDLVKISARASSALQTDFRSPERHAEAALILLTLTLHESTYNFHDTRTLLCRATAHMAFARALDPQFHSDAFLAADALLRALQVNQAGALDALRDPAFDSDVLKPWRNIVELNCTRDYRGAAKERPASFLELCEAFRAYASCSNNIRALKDLRMNPASEPRWMAILTYQAGDVASGHVVAAEAWEMHVKEASECYVAYHGNAAEDRIPLSKMLNNEPLGFFDSGAAEFGHVIGWGQMSMFLQRQLCTDIAVLYQFFEDSLGDPERAEELRRDIRGPALGDLWLMAENRWMSSNSVADYHASVEKLYAMTETRPHLVSRANWTRLSDVPSLIQAKIYLPAGKPHPYANEWFLDSPLPGTSYEMDFTRFFPAFYAGNDGKKRAEQALARAPYDYYAMNSYFDIVYKDEQVPAEELTKTLGKLAEYDVTVTSHLAQRTEDEEAMRLLRPLVSQSSTAMEALVASYRSQLPKEEFAEYAEKLMTEPERAVSISHLATEMVDYYMDGNRDADALRWAEFGSTVYSAAGLRAHARYFERRKEFEKAIPILQASAQRYQNPTDLINALIRYRAEHNYQGADDMLKRLLATTFPDGLKEVHLADFSDPPSRGIAIDGESSLTKKAGLTRKSVIVACNGVRVETFIQYQVARDSNIPEPFVLIVFERGKYREVTANPPNRRFGVDMVPWKK